MSASAVLQPLAQSADQQQTSTTTHRIRLLTGTSEYAAALLAAIEAAQSELLLESYMFTNSNLGNCVLQALCAAAQRQVTVRVLVDGHGSEYFLPTLRKTLENAGGQVLAYRPEIGRLRWKRHRLRRLHRKMLVVDRQMAFIGGLNIDDRPEQLWEKAQTLDFAMQITGPVVRDMLRAMLRLWDIVSWANIHRRLPRQLEAALPQSLLPLALQPVAPLPWQGPRLAAQPMTVHIPHAYTAGITHVQLLLRDNLRHRRTIEAAYLYNINRARHSVFLAIAYFYPSHTFVASLCAAARRGVQVHLFLQGWSDHTLAYWASQQLYAKLLAAGVRIFEYRGGLLHAKVAVVDSQWCTVGSSNLDPFSLLLAREANVAVQHGPLAKALQKALTRSMHHLATEVSPEAWIRRSWLHRLLNRLSHISIRITLSVLGLDRAFDGR